MNIGGDDLTSAGGSDIFLAKFDSGGHHIWSRRFGGPHDDTASGAAVDGEGNIVLTGSFMGAIDLGGAQLTARGVTDAFLAKFSPSGGALWGRSFGDSAFQAGVAVAVEAATSRIILAGDFVASIDLGCGDLVGAGSSDLFLAQFDSGGACRWSKRFGDSDTQETRRLAVDARTGITLMSAIQGTVNFGGADLVGGSNPHLELFVARFDSEGGYRWSQSVMAAHVGNGLDHSAMEDSRSMAVDRDGTLHVVVSSSEGWAGGGQDFEAPGNSHLIVAHFAEDGSILGHEHYGVDPGVEFESGMAVDAMNRLQLIGTFDGDLNLGGGWFHSASARSLLSPGSLQMATISKAFLSATPRRFG